jgi:hypothetical protein
MHADRKVGFMANGVHKGVSPGPLLSVSWRKSSRSGAVGNCVEVAFLQTGQLAMRNSRHPQGPALVYTRAQFVRFLDTIKDTVS